MPRSFPLGFITAAVGTLAASALISAPAVAGPRAEIVWVDPVADLAPDIAYADAPISNILFINRCPGGCVITPGSNDARANTSSVVGGTRTLSEFAHGDTTFDAVRLGVTGDLQLQIGAVEFERLEGDEFTFI